MFEDSNPIKSKVKASTAGAGIGSPLGYIAGKWICSALPEHITAGDSMMPDTCVSAATVLISMLTAFLFGYFQKEKH